MNPPNQSPMDSQTGDATEVSAPPGNVAAKRRTACPEKLDPQALVDAIRDDDWLLAVEGGLARCRECGQCDHIAPSAEPLLPWLRYGKGELAWHEYERARAQLSRQRHIARQARLERQAQARAERLKAREKTTPTPASDNTPAALPPAVAAALARARQRTTAAD